MPFGYKFITTNAQSSESEKDLYTNNADKEDIDITSVEIMELLNQFILKSIFIF